MADKEASRGQIADDADPEKQTTQLPPRPAIPQETERYTSWWWDATAETPESRDYSRQVIADGHDLFPFDEARARRNQQDGDNCGLRTKADARLVQNPHLFRAAQRAVAMTIPDGHTFTFRARRRVASPGRQKSPLGSRPEHVRFANTLDVVIEDLLDEIEAQSILEDWVRDASCYRAGILKAWWQSDYRTTPLSQNRLHDMQDELAEVESLLRDYSRGVFTKQDGRFLRMVEMQQAIQEQTQLRIWQGICAETVDLDRFRIDPRVKSVDSFYSAKWMSEDLVLTKRDILSRFGYQLDDQDYKGFTGVHPDDLNRGRSYDNSGDRQVRSEEARRNVDREKRGAYSTSEAASGPGTSDDDALFLVRQVWIRDEGKVLILVEGLSYPASEWTPINTPANWYPYYPLVINRQPKKWFGRSDTELASDEQARINQKQTDAEKHRDLSAPRGVYNKGAMDEQEAIKIGQIGPGEIAGLNMAGDSLTNNFAWLEYPWNPQLEDVSGNLQMLDKMVGFSESFMGNIGADVQFATQAQLAAAGTNIMIRSRQALVRRALQMFYSSMAEIVIQCLDENQVKLIAGEEAYWPRLYGDAESSAMQRELMQATMQQVAKEMTVVASDPEPAIKAMEFPGIETPAQRAQAIYEQEALRLWGQLEPMTRKSLFQRLQVRVKTDSDGLMAKQTRFANMATAGDFLAKLGVRLSPKAAASLLAELLDLEDEVDDLVTIDPNIAVQDVLSSMQENPDSMTPEALRLLANIGQLANQRLQEVAIQQGEAAAMQVAGQAEQAITAGMEGGVATEPASELPVGEAPAGTVPE
jgi:hypothetical protein